ncbi:MAG TPA: dihydrolipoamide acetyltransferase family protein [Bacteroidia bacterium]|nr:dihydrolipoamide acetyltransferase family protein [Bacteroidia bacterium]
MYFEGIINYKTMAEIVRMPKMSDTMTEGVVSKWHKKVGDKIKSGDLVADIETDKATMEFESYQEGVLLYIGVDEGKAAPVDGVLAIVGKEGEDFSKLLEEEKKKVGSLQQAVGNGQEIKTEVKKEETKKVEVKKEIAVEQKISVPVVSELPTPDSGLLKASPLARKLAAEKGINLNFVKGTGDFGRIVKRDIDWFKAANVVTGASAVSAAAVTKESFTDVALSQMRKTIAKRLSESKSSSPHYYLTMEIDMDDAIRARESINAVMGVKVSFNDIIIKAVATTLRHHPKVNASWHGDFIRMNNHIHIGVAVAVEEGLLVPVVRFADSKTLTQINSEVKDFSQRARDKKLQPKDWEGNTFTISNLGMFGIEEFTAIINPPDSCILAIGGIQQKPVVRNNSVVPGNVMKVTMSCDHRAVDGATGSQFLQTLKGLLENPVILLGQGSI